MPKIATVVVVYNGMKWLEKCLSSLRNSTFPLQVIAVDNQSTDGSRAFIANHFPEVQLIAAEQNLGFGKANNIGFELALEAQADYVLLLNQDAWIDANMIVELIDVVKQNPSFGILSPFHLNYTGSATESYFDQWVLKHYTPEYVPHKTRFEQNQSLSCSFVHAACWLMPMETVKEVGGFDPVFFHYGEDNDYVQRVHHKGFKVGIVPSATVYHQGTNEGLISPSENVRHLTNQILLRLKSPEASHLGAAFLFFKQYCGVMLKGANSPSGKAYREVFRRLPEVFLSRFKQRRRMAYL